MTRSPAWTLGAASVLTISVVIGCASEDAACRGGSLEDYCSGECETYDEALAAAAAAAAAADALEDLQECNDDGTLNRQYSGVGVCGDFRWVMTRPSLDDFTEYFDASGAMVGAIHGTDCNCFCGNSSFTQDYGFVPDCEQEPIDTPCEPGV